MRRAQQFHCQIGQRRGYAEEPMLGRAPQTGAPPRRGHGKADAQRRGQVFRHGTDIPALFGQQRAIGPPDRCAQTIAIVLDQLTLHK